MSPGKLKRFLERERETRRDAFLAEVVLAVREESKKNDSGYLNRRWERH